MAIVSCSLGADLKASAIEGFEGFGTLVIGSPLGAL
jgi:hypothetical protein